MSVSGVITPRSARAENSAGVNRRLLFLFADTGGGHRAGAEAVAGEVRARHGDGFDVHLLDPFAEVAPRLMSRIVDLYSPLIRFAPWAWGLGYHVTDTRTAVRAMRGGFLRFVEPGLAAAIRELQPAAVVSFHPLLNHVSARVVRLPGVPHVPVVTVITDLVDVHASWTCADVDAVVTPSPGGLDHCRRVGLAAERCHDLGLPVGAAFTRAPPDLDERRAIRRALGLDPDCFTVLLTGGGEGSGGMARRLRPLLRARLDLQVVVICGRNQALFERLRELRAVSPTRLRVEGFVGNMAEWMRAADVAITKAGPGTIAEALCSGTPLLLASYLPGQERANVGYVVSTGAGRWVPHPAEMVDTVRELATPGSPALAAMRDALGHAARPAAAARIADLVCELAAAGVHS